MVNVVNVQMICRVIGYAVLFTCVLGISARLFVPALIESPDSVMVGIIIWLIAIGVAVPFAMRRK